MPAITCTSFRWIPYFISQYILILLPGLCLLCLRQTPQTSMTKEFKSATPKKPWDTNEIPQWYVHTSDLHMTVSKAPSYNNLVKRLKKAVALHPNKVIMTGDIVDNYDNKTNYVYQKQQKRDWDLFFQIMEQLDYSMNDMLIYPGNHDVYNIADFDSNADYGKDHYWSKDNYTFARTNLSDEISIFGFNPYEFPTANAYMLWWAHSTSSFRKDLETKIKEVSTDIQFLTTHAATLLWYPRSYIHKVIENAPKARLILTGHFHPKAPIFYHHGDTLEVVGQPMFRDTAVGLITVDNSRVSYHQCNLTGTIKAFFTNPTPRKQASSFEVFNEKNTEVRVLAFTNINKMPELEVTGAINSTLTCQAIGRYTRGVFPWLCSAPMNLEFGEYSISVQTVKTPENENVTVLETIDFVLGDTIKPFSEDLYTTERSVEYVIITIIFGIALLLICIPSLFIEKLCFKNNDDLSNPGIFSQTESWIEGKNDVSTASNWIISFIGGPILIRKRITSLPLYHQFILLLAAIWLFCLPNFFWNNDGKTTMMWSNGYVINGKSFFNFYGYKYGLQYVLFALLPAVLMSSSIGGTYWCHWAAIFDSILYCLSFWGIAVQAKQMAKENGNNCGYTGPMTMIIPVLLFVALLVAGIFQRIQANKEEFGNSAIRESLIGTNNKADQI